MKRAYKKILLITVILLFHLQAIAAETYTLDPTHTYAAWQVSHFGFSTISGKFMAKGKILFNPDHPQYSKVYVTLITTHPNTGIQQLDDTLRSSSFLDVRRYPSANFVSTKVVMTGKQTAKVFGILTLRGVSRPVMLNVKLTRYAIHPFFRKKALGIAASTVVRRSHFGLGKYAPGVGDEVHIDIQAEALR